MKRHPALRELSSDHHQGLVQARRLVRVARNDVPESQASGATVSDVEVAKVAHDFLTFWAEHTIQHFREEEEVLLPAFARYGDPTVEPVVRMLTEHIHMRRLVDDLQHQVEQGKPSVETMHAIGEMLRGHIRHEEDVLFPLIETAMPEEALLVLSNQLAAMNLRRTD